jgi:transposase
VEKIITAARVLIEREERRRGQPRTKPNLSTPKGRNKGESRAEANKLPSMRYPDLEVKEEIISLEQLPVCPCCQSSMRESGLFDISEKLEVIPKIFYILRTKRQKFNCPKCYGAILTTPPRPSILPTLNYGDSVIVDVALSKFCDLIPIERYAEISMRSGLDGILPPQSLIGLTHHLANFFANVYEKIKTELLQSIVLHADETPHKMLEGDERFNWYLWGFFSSKTCIFEAHANRSGDVAFEFLKKSNAQVLISDGYAGYSKAIKMVSQQLGRHIDEAHCNAHAYRYFKEASQTWKDECEIFLKYYGQIYELERERKELPPESENGPELRKKMIPLFDEIKKLCSSQIPNVMPGSLLLKAMTYFINHFSGLTLCTLNLDIPLDNNLAERELRSPVVGRKTWIGTHSKRGALTMAILFSIVQTCKLNNVNPRNYFPWVIKRIHNNQELLTPSEYAVLNKIASG